MRSIRVVSSSLWRELACFYVITGAVSVWSSTWTFSREGITARIFDPSTTFIVAVYFLVPILQLLLTGNQSTKDTDLVPQIPRVPRFFERFTLLLVVLSCLTVLSGYFIYHNFGYDATYKAKVKAKTLPNDTGYRLRTIEMGLHWYRAQYGTLPTGAQGLSALWDNPGVDQWNWIYGENEDMLVDGWNTRMEYRPGTNGFVLRSASPDRQFNTDDDLTVTAE